MGRLDGKVALISGGAEIRAQLKRGFYARKERRSYSAMFLTNLAGRWRTSSARKASRHPTGILT